MTGLFILFLLVGLGYGVRKAFGFAKANPQAAIACVGLAKSLIKR